MKSQIMAKDATKLRELIAEYEICRNRAENAMMRGVEAGFISVSSSVSEFPNRARRGFYAEIARNHAKCERRARKDGASVLKRIKNLISKLTKQEE